MKIVGLEEHYLTAELAEAWAALPPEHQDILHAAPPKGMEGIQKKLLDIGEGRIQAMDQVGMQMQVLSLTSPGLHNLEAIDAVRLQKSSNDLLAATVKGHPERFQGFASLATPDPQAAADELERSVKLLNLSGAMLCGRTRNKNLDHPDLDCIFATAAKLRAPLYLHPQGPTDPVRAQYYDGFSSEVSTAFALFGIGWHYETGIQLLRLILAGTLDRYPDLQLIVGHWGEVVLFYLDRLDAMAVRLKIPRSFTDYFRTQISITPGGIMSQKYLRWAKETVGVDRILFALDYPYGQIQPNAAQDFLMAADLIPEEREAVAWGNWQRLLGKVRR